MDKDMNDKKKQLRWKCRRGMLELDLILGSFLEKEYEKLPMELKKSFLDLLESEDQDLYHWLVKRELPIGSSFLPIIKKIINIQEQCANVY